MKRNNKILAISITDYNDPKLDEIKNCYDDTKEILGILNSDYAFDDTTFIYKKEETTRKALYRTVADYFQNCLEDENVLLIFAGHGQFNSTLEMAYWQPSDSTNDDPSGWISMTELLNFIKHSKAHHISILADSCFAGALFDEPSRGGGVEAIDQKRSRQALTSGGLENVSDGEKGKHSPFAAAVINTLKNNKDRQTPFSNFAYSVVTAFDKERKQTPQFGDLRNMGHEGGTFFLEKKSSEAVEIIKAGS